MKLNSHKSKKSMFSEINTIPEDEIIDIVTVKPVTAYEFILSMRPAIPFTTGGHRVPASNSEVRRWLEQSAVLINGVKPKPKDVIQFPVTQLVFFPKNPNSRTTVI